MLFPNITWLFIVVANLHVCIDLLFCTGAFRLLLGRVLIVNRASAFLRCLFVGFAFLMLPGVGHYVVNESLGAAFERSRSSGR